MLVMAPHPRAALALLAGVVASLVRCRGASPSAGIDYQVRAAARICTVFRRGVPHLTFTHIYLFILFKKLALITS